MGNAQSWLRVVFGAHAQSVKRKLQVEFPFSDEALITEAKTEKAVVSTKLGLVFHGINGLVRDMAVSDTKSERGLEWELEVKKNGASLSALIRMKNEPEAKEKYKTVVGGYEIRFYAGDMDDMREFRRVTNSLMMMDFLNGGPCFGATKAVSVNTALKETKISGHPLTVIAILHIYVLEERA